MITKTPPEVLSPSDLAYMSTLNERDRRWFLATKAADLKTQGLSYSKVSKIILDFFDIRDGRKWQTTDTGYGNRGAYRACRCGCPHL